MGNWPTYGQGNGWSSNVSGRGKFLRILSPNLRCFVQAADGSIKRMTNSRQWMFRSFLISYHPFSPFSHLMSFCPTRMSSILSADTQILEHFVSICDVISTANIKPDKTSDVWEVSLDTVTVWSTVYILQVSPENSWQWQQFDHFRIEQHWTEVLIEKISGSNSPHPIIFLTLSVKISMSILLLKLPSVIVT